MKAIYSFDLEAFANKYLQGDVRNLAKLSFGLMQVLPHQYDFALMDHMDCDDTNLSWEIYNRIWSLERMPESPPLEVGMVQPQWRGDTINSFRTLFGHEIIVPCVGGDGIVGFKGLRRFGVEKELFDKVHEFWYTYHCIGNFIPFPNAKVGNKTINTYRTTWHDYFDLFLENLYSCLVYGKAASELSRQIREDDFEKEYLAVVHGAPEESSGTFRDLLGRDKARKMTYVAEAPGKGIQEALLDYEVLARTAQFSRVRVTLRTGRTHQIRVQFASRGMPLVGERKYCTLEDPCEIALWSHKVGFTHPATGERMVFTHEPPEIYPWTEV